MLCSYYKWQQKFTPYLRLFLDKIKKVLRTFSLKLKIKYIIQMRLMNYIRLCDIFAQPVQLNLSSQGQHRSIFSGCISINIFVIFLLLFYQGVRNLLEGHDFSVYSYQSLNLSPHQTDLDFSKLFMAFRVDEDVEILASQLEISQKSIKYGENASFVKCESKHFEVEGISIPYFTDYENYKCLPLNFRYELSQAQLGEEKKVIKISMKSNRSASKLETVFSNIHIDTQLGQNNVAVYLIRESFDLNSKLETLSMQLTLDETNFNIDTSFLPFINMQEQQKVYATNLNTQSQYVLQFIHIQRRDDEQDIFSLEVRISNKVNYFFKKYKTFDVLLAYLGGLLKIIVVLVGAFMQYYNRFGLYINIANHLYNFNIPVTDQNGKQSFTYDLLTKKIKSKLNKVKENHKALKNAATRVVAINKLTPSQQDRGSSQSLFGKFFKSQTKEKLGQTEIYEDKYSFLDAIFDEILKSQKKIRMLVRYLISKFCCNLKFFSNMDVQLIDEAVRMVKCDLDILVIMDRLQDIDKLKKVLLTEGQMLLFDYTPKPVIKIEKKPELLTDSVKLKFSLERQFTDMSEDEQVRRRNVTNNYPHLESIGRRKQRVQDRTSLFGSKSNFNDKTSYFKLQNAYENLVKENKNLQDRDLKWRNAQLMNLIGRRLVQVFETSLLIQQRQDRLSQNIVNYVRDRDKTELGDTWEYNTKYHNRKNSPTAFQKLEQVSPDSYIPDFSVNFTQIITEEK